MTNWRAWLFHTVAPEITMRGLQTVHLKYLGAPVGETPEHLRERFPNNAALMAALIDEISASHQEFLERLPASTGNLQERNIGFLVNSLEFAENNPTLAEIIVLGLLGTDPHLKERVFDNYERVFSLFLDDFLEAGLIPNKSLALVVDLTEILLSVIFLEGCPKLQMDYLSFVDPEKVAASTLRAIQQYMLHTETHYTSP